MRASDETPGAVDRLGRFIGLARGLGDEPVPRGRHLDRFPPSVRRSLYPLQTKLDGTLGALSRGHHLRDGRVVGGGLIRAQVH